MRFQTIRKILTRDFVLGFLAQLSFSMTFQILVPTLPIYLSRLGSQEAEIGLLIGIFFVSSLVFRPFVGKALLKLPEKNFMIAGALLFSLTSIAFLVAPPFFPFLIIRIVQGIGLALFHTAVYTLIANRSPEGQRAQSLSYFLLASNFSLALAPSIGMFVINNFGFTPLFLVCSGVSLCCLFFATQLGRRRVPPREDSSIEEGFFLSRKALPPSIISFFSLIIWGSVTAFFPLYAVAHGVANPGYFFTTIALMVFLGRMFGAKMLDLHYRERVIPSVLGLYAISMTLLAFSKTLPMFILVAVMFGAGTAVLTPALMGYAIDRAGSSRGPAIATFTALSDLGLGMGPVIMGIIIRLSSYPIMFLCLALTGVINVIYFYFLVRKKG